MFSKLPLLWLVVAPAGNSYKSCLWARSVRKWKNEAISAYIFFQVFTILWWNTVFFCLFVFCCFFMVHWGSYSSPVTGKNRICKSLIFYWFILLLIWNMSHFWLYVSHYIYFICICAGLVPQGVEGSALVCHWGSPTRRRILALDFPLVRLLVWFLFLFPVFWGFFVAFLSRFCSRF